MLKQNHIEPSSGCIHSMWAETCSCDFIIVIGRCVSDGKNCVNILCQTYHHNLFALQPCVCLSLLCYSPPLVPILSFSSASFNPHLSYVNSYISVCAPVVGPQIYFYIGPRNTRRLKYDRDDLYVNKSQFVPVIFEPPCILNQHNSMPEVI
jgi:hypothetical protein